MKMVKNKKRGGRRLAPDEVYELRVSALGGVAHQRLARRYGVSQSTATRAINGDTHTDVPWLGVPLGASSCHRCSIVDSMIPADG